MRLLTLLLVSALTSPLFATEDHGIGKISTDELDLTYIDHVLTGRVGDRPVFAKPLEGEFGLYLWHRAHGQNYESSLRVVDEEIVGDVISATRDGSQIEQDYRVTAYSTEEGTIAGTIGDQTFHVQISADEMDGHHYIEPHFSITLGDSTTYEFTLEDSQACMGCAMKLSYAIISMLHSYGTL